MGMWIYTHMHTRHCWGRRLPAVAFDVAINFHVYLLLRHTSLIIKNKSIFNGSGWQTKPRPIAWLFRMSGLWLWGCAAQKPISTRLGFKQICLWSRNNTSSGGAFHLAQSYVHTWHIWLKWPTIKLRSRRAWKKYTKQMENVDASRCCNH